MEVNYGSKQKHVYSNDIRWRMAQKRKVLKHFWHHFKAKRMHTPIDVSIVGWCPFQMERGIHYPCFYNCSYNREVEVSLGLPKMLVTDNGPSFESSEFTDFVKANGIQHVKTVSYHPASNGLAKRAVCTFKTCMKKLSNGSLRDRVNSFLFKYRTTP